MAGAEIPIMINPAGKNIVIDRAAPPLEPGQQAGPSVLEQFELTSASHSAPLAMALDRPYTYTRELATFQLTHSRRPKSSYPRREWMVSMAVPSMDSR